MVTKAQVKLWGRTVGAVVWDEQRNVSRFQFDEDFTYSALDIAPLMMPLANSAQGKHIFEFPALNERTFRGLPGMLADSLPDNYGDQLMNAWLRGQGRQPGTANAVERLCYTGHRGMGALEYEPSHHELESSSEALNVKDLVRVAGNVLQQRENFKTSRKKGDDAALTDIIRVGTSAGGARAKAVVAFNVATGEVRSGQVDGLDGFSYCLIKFDGVTNKALGDPAGYGRIEFAYHLMVLEAGIEMMPCRLLEENDRAHFITQRFDRLIDEETGQTHKLHMSTLCGIAHYDYNEPLTYSYEDAFQVMRLLNLPYAAAEELFRRMCFNVIARDQDDHTKNISFLMDNEGHWFLSPAYDVTFAYNPDSMWLRQHQMSLQGKREGFTRDDLLQVAKKMNIKKPSNIIDQVNAAIAHWRKHAKEAGVAKDQIKTIQQTFLKL